MPQKNPGDKVPHEAREAITAAVEAIADYHNEITSSGEKVIAKIAQAARSVGWPNEVVSGVVDQAQTAMKAQLQMMNHTMALWREQIKSWPDLNLAGQWPGPDDFKAMSAKTAQLWNQMGENWQKNWAQTMMSKWTASSRRDASSKTEDRE